MRWFGDRAVLPPIGFFHLPFPASLDGPASRAVVRRRAPGILTLLRKDGFTLRARALVPRGAQDPLLSYPDFAPEKGEAGFPRESALGLS